MGGTTSGRRFVEEFGGRGETLLLVHGLGGTTNTWYPQAQVLKRDFRLLAYDLAGSGRSPAGDGISIESHVDDLSAVIGDRGGGRVHLAGHSLGTIVCQHFAAKFADQVASLAAAAFVRESVMAQPAEGYARNCEAADGRLRLSNDPRGSVRDLRHRQQHRPAPGSARARRFVGAAMHEVRR